MPGPKHVKVHPGADDQTIMAARPQTRTATGTLGPAGSLDVETGLLLPQESYSSHGSGTPRGRKRKAEQAAAAAQAQHQKREVAQQGSALAASNSGTSRMSTDGAPNQSWNMLLSVMKAAKRFQASLNPTYTYGAQKEGSMSPPPAPSISALQTATHARRVSSSDGGDPVVNRSMKKTFSNRGRNLTGLLMSGLPRTPEEAQQEH